MVHFPVETLNTMQLPENLFFPQNGNALDLFSGLSESLLSIRFRTVLGINVSDEEDFKGSPKRAKTCSAEHGWQISEQSCHKWEFKDPHKKP